MDKVVGSFIVKTMLLMWKTELKLAMEGLKAASQLSPGFQNYAEYKSYKEKRIWCEGVECIFGILLKQNLSW